MSYRDEMEAAQARIRTLSAELEAEREKRQAAEATARAAEAARDELKLLGAAPVKRRRLALLLAAVAGIVLIGALGAVFVVAQRQVVMHSDISARGNATEERLQAGVVALRKELRIKKEIKKLRAEVKAVEGEGEGLLSIASTRPAATYLDGERIGTTPLARVKVKSGQHHLKLQAAGCPTVSRTISVRNGETTSLSIDLTPLSEH